jgi:hypothetical protein
MPVEKKVITLSRVAFVTDDRCVTTKPDLSNAPKNQSKSHQNAAWDGNEERGTSVVYTPLLCFLVVICCVVVDTVLLTRLAHTPIFFARYNV